jgi:hypothetical protein
MRPSPRYCRGPIGTKRIVAHATNLPGAEIAVCRRLFEALKTHCYSNLKSVFQEIEQVSRKMSMIS